MLRPLAHQYARRGAVLIVVLAMLVLFAVLGLSFVLYSEAQLSAARSQKLSVNQDTKPNPQLAAEGYLGGLIYDVGDTGDDLANPIRGHSLARSKYGQNPTGARLLPFSADPMQPEPGFNWNGITDSRQVVRHTWDTGTSSVFDPERLHSGVFRASPTAALTGTYQGKNYSFTYPDRHDYYLAFQDPQDGRITVPSFHRSGLGSWDPNSGASYFENQGPAGKFRTLRPRAADGHVNFPPVPPNADGTYSGDVQNMTFTAGVQHNDSYWMDAGGPVLRWRGRNYKPMVAPLVLDLSSRVNLSVSGNVRPADPAVASGHPRHTSNMGFGPWEVNPTGLMTSGTMTNAELLALARTRWPAVVTAPQQGARPDSSPFETTLAGRLNNGLLPPVYSRLDPDGLTASAAADAVTLPPVGGPIPFPTFPNSRYPDTAAAMTARNLYHPSLFNPFQHARGRDNGTGLNKAFGLNDAVAHTARYSDPKGRHLRTEYGAAAPTAMADHFFRATTTPFSVSQQVPTASTYTASGTQALLGPIDLNRPLTDYRRNPTLPHSPMNNWSPTALLEAPHFAKARQDRQTLARDIFVRLAARAYTDFGTPSGLGGTLVVNGTRAAYNPATGYLTVNITPASDSPAYKALQRVAQVAANIVDNLDPDDVSTAFVWNPFATSFTVNPLDPSADASNFAAAEVGNRVVFGNELPKLVLNEVYSSVNNTRDDPLNALQQAQRPLVRRHWIELHNPTPADATRPDLGSARLRYEQAVTQLPDPTTGTPVAYTGATYNVYRIEVAESQDAPEPQPYSRYFWDTNPVGSAVDTAAILNMTLQVRIDAYSHDATAPSAAATLAATPDELNLVRPLTGATGTNGANNGFYVIGPRDQFPAGGVTNTLSLPDGGAPTAAAPVNALSYPVTPGAPTEVDITAAVGRRSVFILRRLANPYLPFDAVSNPFITIDYVERMPVRDRATNNSTGAHTPAAGNTASLGRRHPYAAAAGVNDQTAAGGVAPPHTLFAPNSNRDTTGFSMAWMKHLDRQVVNSIEQLYIQRHPPATLTQNFNNGGNYADGNAHSDVGGWTSDSSTFRLLTTRSRMPGIPLGGREPGRLNLNTINDVRLLTAVMDPQGGNNIPLPGDPGYTGGFANDRWEQLFVPPTPYNTPNLRLRTPLRVPAATRYEGGLDCPFDGMYSSTGHLVRTSSNGSSGIGVNRSWFTTGGDEYTAIDPLRKVWNSVTTTSDSLLLVMTVGFFEVTATNPALPISVTNPAVFGAELFNTVSGDLRTKFAAVVDRSQMAVALDAATGLPQVGGTVADATPWQTALAEDAFPGTNTLTVEGVWTGSTARVFLDGRGIDLPFNTPLRLGFGDGTLNAADGEPVTVTAAAQKMSPDTTGALTIAVPNRVTLTLSSGLARPHGAGSPFGNGLFGHPGPQPGVTLKQLQARGLVPYLTRLDP